MTEDECKKLDEAFRRYSKGLERYLDAMGIRDIPLYLAEEEVDEPVIIKQEESNEGG